MDAVAGAGLEAVEDGRINASFLYPTGGEQVIRTAMRIIQGEPVDKFIPLRTAPVDHQSARTLLLQADQLQKYKQRIEAQQFPHRRFVRPVLFPAKLFRGDLLIDDRFYLPFPFTPFT